MRKLVQELAQIWPDYRLKEMEDKNDRAYQIIYDDLKAELESWCAGESNLSVGSSGGTGRITAGPWFAAFDTRITTEAQKGFYLVYLFSVDMKKLVLELGLATTQFSDFYGDKVSTRAIIRQSALKMQSSIESICQSYSDQKFIKKLSKEESDLSTTKKNKLQIGYEKASILHLEYDIEGFNETLARSDFNKFLELYQKIAASDKVLSVDDLFDYSIVVSELIETIKEPEVKTYTPREKKEARRSGGKGGKRNPPKESTKKIGDLGEKIVLRYEQSKLRKCGLAELIPLIVHEEAENNRPGWDISSFDELGKPIQIEVKATKSKQAQNITLTANEWAAAQEQGSSFHLYLVSGVSGNVASVIEILKDPCEEIKKHKLSIEPSAFNLTL
ncbi:MrcB family domain-containing protein [Vibrio cyclitrophicus]|uniref:MrcB family domain-containing protein n=1 Tax=Vibrio cyclitrophicus TaxID=47951 RepID=UPI0002E892E0|nr:DUF3578 domain-containing protein [Vibrio cyclitrophicus]OED86555.1 hypothetical protein OAQ_09990 [Vibrio cyclitrophicus ZF30]OEE19414.1 hypothetical protein OC1_18810 [Vibrio cyclitrophicus ZF207]PMJ34168.1 hypothetical protein BCU25_09605 [Vibrio cyclitrophicus]PMP49463.1 hypothetical protein BCS84_06835 [Vibrio cyclitrophicus]